MTELLHPTALGEGISFFALRDPKFKHDRLSLSLVLPLEEDKLAQRAIVPYLLRQGTERYPSWRWPCGQCGKAVGLSAADPGAGVH